MTEVRLRRMHEGDLEAVCSVDRLSFTVPWSRQAFLAELHEGHAFYRVALLEGAVVGYLGSHLVLDEAHVTTLGVHPAVRRRRVGERLLAEFLGECLRRGCRRITLEVREGNAAALGLYRKYGFQVAGRRRRYYPDNDEDALIMTLEELDGPRFQGLYRELQSRLESQDSPSPAHLRAEARRP